MSNVGMGIGPGQFLFWDPNYNTYYWAPLTAPEDGQVLTWDAGLGQPVWASGGAGALLGYTEPLFYANTVIGDQTRVQNVVAAAARNSVFGYAAGQAMYNSHDCTFVGAYAGNLEYGGHYATMVGAYAGANSLYSSDTYVGYAAGRYQHGYAGANAAVGYNAMQASLRVYTGSYQCAVFGYEAASGANFNGAETVVIGSWAGWALAYHGYSVIIGGNAGNAMTDAWNETVVGFCAGQSITTQSDVSHFGYYAGRNSTAAYTCFFGSCAGYANNGAGSVAFGYQAGYYTRGDHNVALGYQSMLGNVTTYSATQNVAAGYRSLYAITSGNLSVALGHQAGDSVTTGTQLVLVGANTDAAAATDVNEIAIGYQAVGKGSNTALYGNTAITDSWLRGTTFHFGNEAAEDIRFSFQNSATASGRPGFLWDESATEVQVSHDGTNFEKVASGSLPFTLQLLAGVASTSNGSGAAAIVGRTYFNVTDLANPPLGTRSVKFKVIVETTNAADPVNMQIYDVGGITGSVGLIASSLIDAKTDLIGTYYEVDMTADFASVASSGILECRLWRGGTDVAEVVTCTMAKIDITWS